jgi:hypothetical protein
MIRRFAFLFLLFAFISATGQAASATAPAGKSPCVDMAMSAADCMKMMASSDAGKAPAEKHKGCTPADCLNFMTACSGLSAVPANDVVPAPAPLIAAADYPPRSTASMIGLSLPPANDPPIA